MIRRMLNYLIMTQPGCHYQRCVLDSQPGCDVSFSSQLMKTPLENPWAERTKKKPRQLLHVSSMYWGLMLRLPGPLGKDGLEMSPLTALHEERDQRSMLSPA